MNKRPHSSSASEDNTAETSYVDSSVFETPNNPISCTTVTLHSPLWWAQNGLFLWERLIHVMIIPCVHHEGYSILNNLLHDGYITFTAFKKTIYPSIYLYCLTPLALFDKYNRTDRLLSVNTSLPSMQCITSLNLFICLHLLSARNDSICVNGQ